MNDWTWSARVQKEGGAKNGVVLRNHLGNRVSNEVEARRAFDQLIEETEAEGQDAQLWLVRTPRVAWETVESLKVKGLQNANTRVQ